MSNIDLLKTAADALRFRARQSALVAQHAINTTSDDAVIRSLKAKYHSEAYNITADVVADLLAGKEMSKLIEAHAAAYRYVNKK